MNQNRHSLPSFCEIVIYICLMDHICIYRRHRRRRGDGGGDGGGVGSKQVGQIGQ